jgi:BirA family biotin operon repressor/biotin-[acetyl-CoA-carboxylase] ligase
LSPDVLAETWEGRSAAAWMESWDIPALILLETTPSTNDVAMRMAAEGRAAGTTVIAEYQSRGRGRRGRDWAADPSRSLLMSVILRTDSTAIDPSAAPLRIGLVLARAIDTEAGTHCRIKWPNDVLAPDGRKLAGILCEGSAGRGGTWLVAGIGVNVAQRAEDFDTSIRDTATSLDRLGRPASRARLAARILEGLRPFRIQPPPLQAQLLDELAARDALAGHEITIDGHSAGVADGISPDGGLRIRRDGHIEVLRSGTVRLAARPDTGEDNPPGAAESTHPRATSEAN